MKPKKQIQTEQAMKVLGYNCKRLRKLKGLTQEDMQDFKIPYRGYQNIEAGRTNVTLQTLVRLANAFGVEISELLKSDLVVKSKKVIDELKNYDYGYTYDSLGYLRFSKKKV